MLSVLWQRRTWNTTANSNVYEHNNQTMTEFKSLSKEIK